MQRLTQLGLVALLTVCVCAVGAAIPAFAAEPVYSFEDTAAVVKLHPDDIAAIAALVSSATVEPTAAVESTAPASVRLDGVGSLGADDLMYAGVLAVVALGIAVGRWGRGHSW